MSRNNTLDKYLGQCQGREDGTDHMTISLNSFLNYVLTSVPPLASLFPYCHSFLVLAHFMNKQEPFRRQQVLGLPEVHSVAQGCVAIAILCVNRGANRQQVLHRFQVSLAGSNVQRGPSIIVAQTQITALSHGMEKRTSGGSFGALNLLCGNQLTAGQSKRVMARDNRNVC